jgi:hypothetical protein
MTRLCMVCKQIMGEKCARCGTEATPLKTNSNGLAMTGTEFDCPSCCHHFAQRRRRRNRRDVRGVLRCRFAEGARAEDEESTSLIGSKNQSQEERMLISKNNRGEVTGWRET